MLDITSNGNFYSYHNPIIWNPLLKELDCLKPGDWLSDIIVNGFLFTFRKNHPSCMFLNSHFFVGGEINSKFWYPREDWSQFDWIIIPLHMNNNHWAVIFLHRHSKKLYLSDSFRNSWDKRAYRAVFPVVVKYFADRFGCSKETFSGVSCKMPSQKNGYDCGVYILRYVEEFLQKPLWFILEWDEDKDFNPYPIEWASEFREKVRKTLQPTAIEALRDSAQSQRLTTIESPVETFNKFFDLNNYPDTSETQLLDKPALPEALPLILTVSQRPSEKFIYSRTGVLNVEVEHFDRGKTNQSTLIECNRLMEKLCDAIEGENYCSVVGEESSTIQGDDSLDWIDSLSIKTISSGNVDTIALMKGLESTEQRIQQYAYLRCIKRFRLGLVLATMNPADRMRITGLKDNKPIVYEAKIKSYFISKHPLGKGILRLMDIPWNALAKNAIFRMLVEKQLLEFQVCRNLLQIEAPPTATLPIEAPPTATLQIDEYQLFEDLGIHIV